MANSLVHPTWVSDHGLMHFDVVVDGEGGTALLYVLYPLGLHELTQDGRPWSSTFYYPISPADLAVMSEPWDSSTYVCNEVKSRIDAAWVEWRNQARKSLIEALG